MRKLCPKCGAISGDDWSQCDGDCPLPISPDYHKQKADAILDHKWLDPECGIQGCQSLVLKARYEAAVPTQVVIDDAMVERAWSVFHNHPRRNNETMRAALEAALNPAKEGGNDD